MTTPVKDLSNHALTYFELRAGLRPDWTVEQVNTFFANFKNACKRADVDIKDVIRFSAYQLWNTRPELMTRVLEQVGADERAAQRAAAFDRPH